MPGIAFPATSDSSTLSPVPTVRPLPFSAIAMAADGDDPSPLVSVAASPADQPPRPSPLVTRPLSDDDCRAALERLWALPEASGVPKTKLARAMLLRLFAIRVMCLRDIALHVALMQQEGSESSISGIILKTRLVYTRLARVMLFECISLCDANLKCNWADPDHHAVWTVRNSSNVLDFTMLCLARDVTADDLEMHSTDLGPNFDRRIHGETGLLRGLGNLVTLRTALEPTQSESHQQIHGKLAPAFGLTDTSRMSRILNAAGFVLR